MNLLLITSTYPVPHRPLQGVFNGNLVKALREQHRVRVIAPIPWVERHDYSHRNDSDLETAYPIFYYPPRVLRWTYGYWYWLSIRQAFRKMVEEFRPDVVLGYWAHPDCEAANRAARALGVPSVAMVGGTDVRILAKSWLRGRAIQSSLRNANRVVAFSQDLANHVAALGIARERINVLYRGVDRDLFFPGDRNHARDRLEQDAIAPILLWVGRMVEVKNPAMVINALPVWKQQFGDRLKLVMVGDGPLRNEIENLSRRLAVSENVEFVGMQSQLRLADWYRAANVTVLTSLSEGVPNVLLESIACNTPFVATDVGGVREIANADFDLLVPSQDDLAFQKAVATMLVQDRTRTRPATSHDVHALAGQLIAMLEQLQ